MMTNGINKKVQEGRINAQEKPVIIALIKSVTITRESNVTIAYTEYQMHNMVQFCCKELGFALDTTFSLCGIYWSQTLDTELKDGLILTLENILGPVIIHSLRDRKLFGIFPQQLLSKNTKSENILV